MFLRKFSKFHLLLVFFCYSTFSYKAVAVFLDATGHYSVRGENKTTNHYDKFKAFQQSFQLLGEARANDSASFFLELRLFENPRTAYFGDTSKKRECDSDKSCPGNNQQSSLSPGYSSFTPQIAQAYLRYASEYCILEVGRRARDVGLGVFINSGKKPFSSSISTYDGFVCKVNFQKFQNIEFGIGFDKLQETGTNIRDNYPSNNVTFGETNDNDDIDQIYVYINYDDKKNSSNNTSINKYVSIYAAKVYSTNNLDSGGSKTSINLADVYFELYNPNFIFKNELLFRIGETADKNVFLDLGGALLDDNSEPAVNNISSIGFASSLEWVFSGSPLSSRDSTTSNTLSHSVLFNFSYAPGDSDGYFDDDTKSELKFSHRDTKAKAIAFSSNYKPALILFNGHPQTKDGKISGVFDPNRIMNAKFFLLGYRYMTKAYGNFELDLINAQLDSGPPSKITSYYSTANEKPFGYYDSDLGYEIDLKYWKNLTKQINVGAAAAYLFPGNAWKIKDKETLNNDYLLQMYLSFEF